MSKITGREEIFKGLNLSEGVIGLINKSQTLVDQVHKYNKDILAENVRPIEIDVNRGGIFWSSIEKGIYFGSYGDAGYEALDPRVFVGILSHELGHYINDARDKAREQFYADKMRDNYDVAAIVGVTKETEAAYNNWKIAREIYENNGSLISVLGDRPDYVSAPGYDIYHMLTKVYDSNVGKMSADMLEKAMIEVAGSYLAQASPGANLNVNYYDYYGSAYGASPKRLSHAPVAAVNYSVDFETGLVKSVTLHFSTGMQQKNQYDRGLLSTAALYGPNGQIVEYARYAANGLKTEEIIYDSIGNGTITRIDTNGDGVFDNIKTETRLADGASVIREDTNGDGVADHNFVVNGGQRYDLSNVRDAAFADSLLDDATNSTSAIN